MVSHKAGYGGARKRSLARLRDGLNLGTRSQIGWSRDSVHR
jgi:hypothetical protein